MAFAGVTDAFLTAACVMPNYIYDLLRLKEGEEPVSTDPQHPTTSGEGCQVSVLLEHYNSIRRGVLSRAPRTLSTRGIPSLSRTTLASAFVRAGLWGQP